MISSTSRALPTLRESAAPRFNVELTSTHATNKATYITLKAETPRGSTFDLDVRIGGAHMSQSRVTRKLTADLVGSLREFAALGDGAGTYGRITLTATGSDLEVGPDSFSIATAAARTTGGRFTVAPSPYDR